MSEPADPHINRPRFSEFAAMVRKPGHRNWDCVYTGKSRAKAFRLAADALATGKFKRVLVTAFQDWYGHTVLAEMKT